MATHFVIWINETPGVLSSPLLHREILKVDDPNFSAEQARLSAIAKKLTGDGSFFFRLINAYEAQNIQGVTTA